MQKNRMWDSVWMGNMHNFLHLIGFMSVIATRNIKGSGRKDDGDDGRAVVDDCEWRRPESLYICSLLVNDGNEVALNWLESQTSNEDPLQGGLFHRKRGRKLHRWSVVLIYMWLVESARGNCRAGRWLKWMRITVTVTTTIDTTALQQRFNSQP